MATGASEINFSELSNRPVDAVHKLLTSPTRSLHIHRRGEEEDLMLTTVSRATQVNEAASVTNRLFLALMHDNRARSLVTEVVPTAFPWVRFLPKQDVQAFIVELVDTLEGAESLNNPTPIAQVVRAWQHTAEVYADPELLSILQKDGEDLGSVPTPALTA